MSIFNGRLDRLICEFGETWGSRQNTFRSCFNPVLHNDESIGFNVKCNGRSEEFLRIPGEQYDRCIKEAVRSSRVSGSYAGRFFVWHWLEETNQLELFFNKLKEIQNA
jgi:hypothetical protein